MKKTIGKFISHIEYSKYLFVIFSNAFIGERSLDRFACALGGKTIFNYILKTVQTMLQNRE